MDIAAKHIVITGATAGIGKATATALAEAGAKLTLLNRNPAKAEALAAEMVIAGLPAPTLITMDMSRMSSVRDAAADVLSTARPIDLLVNNAGIVNSQRRVTEDGFEETIAVNHLAVFLLTGLLLPAMGGAGEARIVNVSSQAHAFVRGMGFDDMHAEKRYRTFTQYGRSKLANILFTRSLAQRLVGSGITANSLHPGAVSTSLGQQNTGMLGKALMTALRPFFRTPAQGAATTLYLCRSDAVRGVSGRYYSNCREARPRRWALDDEAAARLWAWSETSLEFEYPEPALAAN